MKRLSNFVLKLRVWQDTSGQDLIEYALMAGMVALAAAAVVPTLASSINAIFTSVKTKLDAAGA
jgi:pilus assembly protein Flp/PilA